mmetsp:Transcript_39334/g.60125  ORF Transcript_39334/g.60125 Transcript_39334/m.60125 type:complete len:111 (-) Transcript_39334:142-474(-)
MVQAVEICCKLHSSKKVGASALASALERKKFFFGEEELESLIRQAKPLMSTELSKKEKADIVKAMGVSRGHWYECPNGHPYVIGDCGGAMERSTCPTCGASIGGAQHSLV